MKITARLLFLFMILGYAVCPVFAESTDIAISGDTVISGGAVIVAEDFKFDTSDGKIVAYNGTAEIVNIPEEINGVTVEKIGAEAFSENTAVKEIIIPQTVNEIWENTMAYYDSYPFMGTESLEKITVDPDNSFFRSEDGVLIENNSNTLLWYPENKRDKEYVVPEFVEEIRKFAFSGCDDLEVYITKKDVKFGIWSFDYSFNGTIHCFINSSADKYAKNNMIKLSYLQKGDVNIDGVINAEDAAIVLQSVLNPQAVDIKLPELCNVRNAEKASAEDAAMILQKALNNAYEF